MSLVSAGPPPRPDRGQGAVPLGGARKGPSPHPGRPMRGLPLPGPLGRLLPWGGGPHLSAEAQRVARSARGAGPELAAPGLAFEGSGGGESGPWCRDVAKDGSKAGARQPQAAWRGVRPQSPS